MQLKHPQIPRARNQIPKQPAFPRPPGELDEIRRVLPRRQLRPIPAHPLLEQEPVEHPHQLEPLINDRPVPHPRRQINTLPLEKADQDQPQHHNPRTPPRTPTPDAPGGAERRAPPDRRFPVALRTPAQRRPGGTPPSDQIEHHPSNSTSKQPRPQHHSPPPQKDHPTQRHCGPAPTPNDAPAPPESVRVTDVPPTARPAYLVERELEEDGLRPCSRWSPTISKLANQLGVPPMSTTVLNSAILGHLPSTEGWDSATVAHPGNTTVLLLMATALTIYGAS